MALSATQKAQIRQYLGYPDLYRYKNVRLEGVLDGNLSAEAETLVAGYLTQLAAIDAVVTGKVVSRAGLKRVDEIEFYEGKQRQEVLAIGRQYVGRLSNALGVPVYGDAFGDSGYPGDSFSEFGLAPGAGNTIKLG